MPTKVAGNFASVQRLWPTHSQMTSGVRRQDVIGTGRGVYGRGLLTAGGMGPMVVEVVHPDLNGVPADLLDDVVAGVEHLVGLQPAIPLDLPVVPRRAGLDVLVPVGQGEQAMSEVHGPIVGAVVGHDLEQLRDAVGCKKDSRPAEEPDGGHRLLVGKVLGVGQPREAVQGRV